MARKQKPRVHGEYFMPLMATTCPCGKRKTEVFAWGEYVNGKWRTVDHFCQGCFEQRVQLRLVEHAAGCGCAFELRSRAGYKIPEWIKLPEPAACQAELVRQAAELLSTDPDEDELEREAG